MNYLVVECHLSYAIVLGEDGTFKTVANLRYEEGQTVTGIVEMEAPVRQTSPKAKRRWVPAISALAACLVLVVGGFIGLDRMPYGSVYMTINPQVRIDVNRSDKVLRVEGLNQDGADLLEGYDPERQKLDPVMDELIDRAIEMGYLHRGGQITLDLDGPDEMWVETTGGSLRTHLEEYLPKELSVTIEVSAPSGGGTEVVIPVPPVSSAPAPTRAPDPTPTPGYGRSDYEEPSLPPAPPSQPPAAGGGYGDSGYTAAPTPSVPPAGGGYGDSGYTAAPTPSVPPASSGYGDSGYTAAPTPSVPPADSGYEDSGYGVTQPPVVPSQSPVTDNGYGDSGYGVSQPPVEPTLPPAGDSGYQAPSDSGYEDSGYGAGGNSAYG